MGNVITVNLNYGCCRTEQYITDQKLYQYDYGQILKLTGIDLPAVYEVHFSNGERGTSTTGIGTADGVEIPDQYLLNAGKLYVGSGGGSDGFSPVVEISEITGGHRISITDKTHTVTADVMDGVDGSDGKDGTNGIDGKDGKDGKDGINGTDGKDGSDGVSPAVSISAITGGNAVTITDATHPQGQTFNVMNGTNGNDYVLTAQDKADIADLVVQLIPSAESEGF